MPKGYRDDISDIVVVFIMTMIFVIFLVFITYNLYTSFRTKIESVNVCELGQCATSILTGVKRCPKINETISYDLGLEVCNSRNFCDNTETPYAVLSDGSTDDSGVCEDGTICRCLSERRCPFHTAAAFRTTFGNLYDSTSTRNVIEQYYEDRGYITVENTGNEFCTISPLLLNHSRPGCTVDVINCSTIKQCMHQEQSPCLHGVLAYIVQDEESIDTVNYTSTAMSCVTGDACPVDQMAFFSLESGTVICRDVVCPPI